MRSLRSVLVELGREKHRGGLEDLVGPAQLVDLFAQLLDLLALGRGRQIRAQALVSLHLAQPPAQRLRRHAEVLGDVRDRATALQDQASAAVEQLRRVLPWTSHGAEDFLSPATEPWNRGLRQTQPGSSRPPRPEQLSPHQLLDIDGMCRGLSWRTGRDLLSSSAELVRAGLQTVELEEAPCDDRNGTRSASSADHR